MRRLWPFALGLAVAAVVAGAGFGVQAVALRRPEAGDLVAAKAVGQMTRYRVVTGVAHLAGLPPAHTVCIQARYRFPGSPGRRWSALVLGGGYRLAEAGGHVRSLAPLAPERAREAGAVFALAGCPHFFTRRLVQGFVKNRRFDLREATFLGQPVYAMPFHVDEAMVVLYVARDSAQPLGARLSGSWGRGWSALTVHQDASATRLRASVLRSLGE